MYRKIFSFLLVLTVVLSLCSCGDANSSSENAISTATDVESNVSNTETSVTSNISNSSQTPATSGTSSVVTVKKEVKAKGIDVSKWQGKIDWKKVKKSGIEFAIIRIGYRAENGNIYKDEFADYNIQQADKAGLLIGVYFFSTAINSAEADEEASWTYNAIKSYPISYPVVYDCEGYNSTDSRMNGIDNANRTQNALTFLNRIKSFGYDGMLYASKDELSKYWDTALLEKNFKIWVARYSSPAYPTVKTPDYNGIYDMWQYTDKGTVSGVNGATDMIVSYFDVKNASPKSNETAPVAKEPVIKDSIYTEKTDTVTAKDVVNLRDSDTTKSNIVGTLKNGETAKRIAVGSNGWSKLSYNGKTVYAVSSYITTDLNYKPEPENDGIYTTVDETVTAKSSTNLRNSATTNGSTVIYTLKNGETVKRIGIGSNGWSKIIYNGQTVYAVSSYLTTDLSYKEPVTSENTSPSNGIVFTDVNEQVTAKSETNLRDKPTTNGSYVIHTLKNGEYVTRTGTSPNGWSRLIYNGQTVYAVSSYLTN